MGSLPTVSASPTSRSSVVGPPAGRGRVRTVAFRRSSPPATERGASADASSTVAIALALPVSVPEVPSEGTERPGHTARAPSVEAPVGHADEDVARVESRLVTPATAYPIFGMATSVASTESNRPDEEWFADAHPSEAAAQTARKKKAPTARPPLASAEPLLDTIEELPLQTTPSSKGKAASSIAKAIAASAAARGLTSARVVSPQRSLQQSDALLPPQQQFTGGPIAATSARRTSSAGSGGGGRSAAASRDPTPTGGAGPSQPMTRAAPTTRPAQRQRHPDEHAKLIAAAAANGSDDESNGANVHYTDTIHFADVSVSPAHVNRQIDFAASPSSSSFVTAQSQQQQQQRATAAARRAGSGGRAGLMGPDTVHMQNSNTSSAPHRFVPSVDEAAAEDWLRAGSSLPPSREGTLAREASLFATAGGATPNPLPRQASRHSFRAQSHSSNSSRAASVAVPSIEREPSQRGSSLGVGSLPEGTDERGHAAAAEVSEEVPPMCVTTSAAEMPRLVVSTAPPSAAGTPHRWGIEGSAQPAPEVIATSAKSLNPSGDHEGGGEVPSAIDARGSKSNSGGGSTARPAACSEDSGASWMAEAAALGLFPSRSPPRLPSASPESSEGEARAGRGVSGVLAPSVMTARSASSAAPSAERRNATPSPDAPAGAIPIMSNLLPPHSASQLASVAATLSVQQQQERSHRSSSVGSSSANRRFVGIDGVAMGVPLRRSEADGTATASNAHSHSSASPSAAYVGFEGTAFVEAYLGRANAAIGRSVSSASASASALRASGARPPSTTVAVSSVSRAGTFDDVHTVDSRSVASIHHHQYAAPPPLPPSSAEATAVESNFYFDPRRPHSVSHSLSAPSVSQRGVSGSVASSSVGPPADIILLGRSASSTVHAPSPSMPPPATLLATITSHEEEAQRNTTDVVRGKGRRSSSPPSHAPPPPPPQQQQLSPSNPSEEKFSGMAGSNAVASVEEGRDSESPPPVSPFRGVLPSHREGPSVRIPPHHLPRRVMNQLNTPLLTTDNAPSTIGDGVEAKASQTLTVAVDTTVFECDGSGATRSSGALVAGGAPKSRPTARRPAGGNGVPNAPTGPPPPPPPPPAERRLYGAYDDSAPRDIAMANSNGDSAAYTYTTADAIPHGGGGAYVFGAQGGHVPRVPQGRPPAVGPPTLSPAILASRGLSTPRGGTPRSASVASTGSASSVRSVVRTPPTTRVVRSSR